MNTYLKIIAYNTCDFADLIYQYGWQQYIYIDSDIKQPVYEVSQTGTKNNDGDFVSDLNRWEKKYLIELLCPEYMVDALQVIALSDNVFIYDKYGRYGQMKNIDVKHEWTGAGCFAKTTITFTSEILTTTKCCENVGGEER